MKTKRHRGPADPVRNWGRGRFARGPERASAVLIVLILLGLVGTLVISNAIVLRQLRVELQFLEEKQKRKFETPDRPGGTGLIEKTRQEQPGKERRL